MKIRFKLSICVIAIMVVMITGINILLLHKVSEISYNLSTRSLMETGFTGRTGSSPAGQYATAYRRETDRINGTTSYDISEAMMRINSSNALQIKEVRAITGFTAVLTTIVILAAAAGFSVIIKFITNIEQQVSGGDESSSTVKEMPANNNLVTRTIINNSESADAKEKRKFVNSCGEQSKLKHAGKVKRFFGISAHTGGITMFPNQARLVQEAQKSIYTSLSEQDKKEPLAADKEHNVPLSTVSNIFDYSFSQSLR